MYFNSPQVGLPENGIDLQGGVRLLRWLTVGFDYTRAEGDLTLTPSVLTSSLQQTLSTALAQLAQAGVPIPPGYRLAIPTHSVSQTFAGGPLFVIRHWKPITLFFRPSLGAIVEDATPRPTDAISQLIVRDFAALGLVPPSGTKHDRVLFYGFGGGIDFNFSRHLALRVQADVIHDHLFSDLLQNGRNTGRIAIGPAFNFGRNIIK